MEAVCASSGGFTDAMSSGGNGYNNANHNINNNQSMSGNVSGGYNAGVLRSLGERLMLNGPQLRAVECAAVRRVTLIQVILDSLYLCPRPHTTYHTPYTYHISYYPPYHTPYTKHHNPYTKNHSG